MGFGCAKDANSDFSESTPQGPPGSTHAANGWSEGGTHE